MTNQTRWFTGPNTPSRRFDGSWDCQYWMSANGIDDASAFEEAWNDPKTHLHLSEGAIVRKIDDPYHGRRIEWWLQWTEPERLPVVTTVEVIK